MRVLELFCYVDDFCRTFEPRWHKQCLSSATRRCNRARELALSELMTIRILFHLKSLSHLQSLLHRARVCRVAQRVSASGQLYALCGVLPCRACTAMPVPAYLSWSVHWRVVCRLDQAGGLSQSAHPVASSLPWAGRAR